MSLAGKEIHRGYDQFGTVRVLDDGSKRYLAFGEQDEQSCVLKSDPYLPQHEYVRAMLLILLFVQPKRVLSFGLGAGSLNGCLHSNFAELKQQVVELRPEVVEVAYKYFQLPRSKRLELITMDANLFLDQPLGKKVDIIFSDIYSEEGLDEQQLSFQFIQQCHQRLKPDGWLVFNCWKEHQGGQARLLLKSFFADVRCCTTQSGNWIIFAGQQVDQQNMKQLKQKAKQLSQQLQFSLSSHLGRLKEL